MTPLKNGRSKVPLDSVPTPTKAVDVDPTHFMRLALDRAIAPPAAQTIMDIFGTHPTENANVWLAELRDASDNTDPRLTARSRLRCGRFSGYD